MMKRTGTQKREIKADGEEDLNAKMGNRSTELQHAHHAVVGQVLSKHKLNGGTIFGCFVSLVTLFQPVTKEAVSIKLMHVQSAML